MDTSWSAKHNIDDQQQKRADLIIAVDCFQATLNSLKQEQTKMKTTICSEMLNYQSFLTSTSAKINQGLSSTSSFLQAHLDHERLLRKAYHNRLMEIRGNIRVYGRVRPLISTDSDSTCVVQTSVINDHIVFINNGIKNQSFELDCIFGPKDSQKDVFQELRPLLTSCVDGYDVSIFAYGQTGSGKTYTMDGSPNDPGVNPRALDALFEEIKRRKPNWNFVLSVSMLEIYNECIRDLLSGETNLSIKMNSNGTFDVLGITSVEVSNASDVEKVLKIGRQTRTTASTCFNDLSSRSHAMLRVFVKGYKCVMKPGYETTKGNAENSLETIPDMMAHLNLVDLAGSERLARADSFYDSKHDDARLRETCSINKSLSAFGDVLRALKRKKSHIPYRNSKLTHMLQSSLAGDGKAAIIVQVSPNCSSIDETICSLKFASKIRGGD